jgi:hypothetical protein
LKDTYFAAVVLPGDNLTEIQTFNDSAPTPANPTPEQLAGAAVGGGGVNRFPLFVGPKDLDILKQVNPKLEQVVDFGWFLHHREAAISGNALAERQICSQLRLGHPPDDCIHQFRAVSIEDDQHEVDEEDAGATTQITAINDKYKNVGCAIRRSRSRIRK